MTDDRRSPLDDRHEALGARLGAFAGWRMPISYEGTVAEHTAVREDVGIFDVSHLGTVWVRGPGATAVIDGSFTNDPRGLADGDSQYTLCATEDGGVLDDLIVYRLDEQRWMAVPNAANTAGVVERLRAVATARGLEVEIDDESTGWVVLAVQGPRAFALVEDRLGVDPGSLSFGQHTRVRLERTSPVMCRTGYTGEPGVELVAPSLDGGLLWDLLVGDDGATPCGLASRDTLRLEMGYPLHGNDLSPSISPYEARSGWAVKPDGRQFVGRDALVAAKEAGVERRLWGLVGDSRRPPRAGMSVIRDEVEIGEVTSGSFSPVLGVGIGLALLTRDVEGGARVEVDVRGSGLPFTVARPPMVDRDPR